MQKREILGQILDNFLQDKTEKNQHATPETIADLHLFCQYAKNWLANRGVVGVGYMSHGLSLRFVGGDEAILFSALEEELPNMPAVGITGTSSSGVRGAAAVANNSVKITG